MAQDPSFSVVEADRRAEEQYRRAAQPAAYSALAQAATTSPEAAALRQRAATILGTIPAAIQDDPDAVTRARVQDDMGRLPAFPATMNWLADPDNAAVAHDQVESLTTLEALLARPAPTSTNPFDRLNQDAASFLGRPGVARPTPVFRTRAPRVGLGTRIARYGLNPTANVGELFAAAGDLGRDVMAGLGQPLASTVEGVGVEAQLTGGAPRLMPTLMSLARPGGLNNPMAQIDIGRYLADEVLIALGLGDSVEETRARVRETGVGIEAAGKSMGIGARNWRGTLTDDDIQQIIASGNSDRILPDRQTETGLVGDVAQGVGQVGGTILISTATRGTLTMPSLYAQGVAQMNTRVEADMAQDGRTEYSERDRQALRAGGAVTAISERLGLDAILGKLPKPIQDRIKGRLSDILVAGFGEGASEVAEGVGQNAAAMTLLDEDTGLFEGTVEGGTVGALVGSIARMLVLTATPGRQYTEDQARAEAAEPAAVRLDNLVDMVARNTLLNRTPERLRNFLTGVSGDDNIYLPAEAAITFFQSSPEAEALLDELDIRDQYEAAQIGDTPIAIPKAAYLMAAAKNPDLHPTMRGVLQDGLGAASIAEAEEFKRNGAAKLAEEMDAAIAKAEQEDAADNPVRAVEAEVFSQLRASGYTVDAARLLAAYTANLSRVEAANNPDLYPDAMAAYRDAGLSIRAAFPASLRQPERAAAVVDAFVRGRAKPASSLAEFVSQDGGMFDTGGQLAAMGADRWHRGKVGKGRLVVPDTFSATGPMPADLADRQPEQVLARAVAAGYLPEGSTVDDLMAALKADIKGKKGKAAAPAFDPAAPENAQALGDLEGLLADLDIDPNTATPEEIRAALDRVAAAPDVSPAQVFEQSKAATRALAQDYKAMVGNTEPEFVGTVQPVLEDMIQIADALEVAEHAPNDPAVVKSYRVLIDQTIEQFLLLGDLKIEAWRGEGQPYADSKAMLADIRNNGHFWFFLTENGFGDEAGVDTSAGHPMMEKTALRLDDGTELIANDVFRVVHDIFGHGQQGFGFGPVGELNAYLEHAAMYSPEARPALAAETAMQNAWVNFGPHLRREDGTLPVRGEPDYIPLADRRFADQKAFVATPEVLELLHKGAKAKAASEASADAKPVQKALDAIKALGEANPLNERETVVEGGGLTVRAQGDKLFVSGLRAIEKGGGRRAMQALIRVADENGVVIELWPVPGDAPAGKTMTQEALRSWYEGLGFTASGSNYMSRRPTVKMKLGGGMRTVTLNQSDAAPTEAAIEARAKEISAESMKLPGNNYIGLGQAAVMARAELEGAPPPVAMTRPPVNPDGTITLTHYSVEADLTETDPTKWGRSGNFLPRSERNMISSHLPRTYFGIGVGQPGGYRPEFADRTVYTTDIDASRLYDAAADPDGFRDNLDGVAQGDRINAIERQIAEKYDGYWLKNELGMTATLFKPVAVVREGAGRGGPPSKIEWTEVNEWEKGAPPEVESLIAGFIGGSADAVANGLEFGVMDNRPLDAVVTEGATGEALDLRKKMDAAFAPMRAMLRAKFGGTVQAYRVQSDLEPESANNIKHSGPDAERRAFSFTTSREFAEDLAGKFKVGKQFSEETIAEAERVFAETGRYDVRDNLWLELETFSGTRYDNGEPFTAQSINVMRGDGFQYDVDSVRAYFERVNEDIAERQALLAERLSKIVTVDVPINRVVWMSDRFNQQELIVAMTPEEAAVMARRERIAFAERDRVFYQSATPDEHPDRISTRLPTTKGAKEDAVANKLTVSTEAMGKKPSVLEHNAKLVSSYPGVRIKARSAQGRARAFIDHVKANLLALFDRVPAETRERSKQWYDGARALTTVWAGRYGLPDRSVAAVLAALSPQKDWYQNVSLAERVLDVWSKRQDYVYDEAMEAKGAELFAKYPDLLAKLRGKSLAQLEHLTEKAAFVRIYDQAHNPRGFRIASPEGQFLGEPGGNVAWGSLVEIAKAVSVLEGQSFENVSFALGDRHKVRNFYNNIISPRSAEGDVTIDTHAVAAGLLRALSGSDAEVFHNFGSSPMAAKQPDGWVPAKNANEFGVSGTYGFYADAYREAAAERGVSAREMQSITWEAVRGLFGAKFKSNKKNVKAINDLWLAHGKGDATLEETINAVIEYAGGIAQPSWDGPGAGLAVAERQASYDGELSRAGLPGRDAGRGADGQPAGDVDPVARVFYQSEPARPAPPFFSALTRAVENEGPEQATPAEWKRWLIEPESVKRGVVRDKATNKPMVDADGNPVISETVIPAKPRAGVKMDEIFWTGTGTWLDALADPDELSQTFAREAGQIDADGNITRQTFLDFLKAGGLRMDEVVLGAFDQATVDARVEEILDEKVDEAVADWDGGSVYIGRVSDDEDGPTTGWGLFADGRLISEDFYDSEEAAQEAADEANQEEEADAIRRVRNDWRGLAIDQAEREGVGGEQTKFADWATSGAVGTYREVLFRLPGIDGPETHWDQSNVVAHVRLTIRLDAEGNRVLFIEEVQSDWHQKGRDQGYQAPFDPVEQAAAKAAASETNRLLLAARRPFVAATQASLAQSIAETEDAIRQAEEAGMSQSLRDNLRDGVNILKSAAANLASSVDLNAELGITGGADSTLIAENLYRRSQRGDLMMRRDDALKASYDAMLAAGLAHNEASQRLQNARNPKGIPDAPFRTSWPALVMKRMIRWAVDHGYERVAWTTGDQQADRYNLSSAVGWIETIKTGDGRVAYNVQSPGARSVIREHGEAMNGWVILTREKAMEVFGQDLGGRTYDGARDQNPVRFDGDDLKIGGEGMRGFYDRNLVNITNDIVKRYGVKVGMIDMVHPTLKKYRELQGRIDETNAQMKAIAASQKGKMDAVADLPFEEQDDILKADPEFVAAQTEHTTLRIRLDDLQRQQRQTLPETGASSFGDQPGFTITPALRDAAMSGFALFQKVADEPRAQIAFSQSGAFITLFQKRDMTSLFHELGHLSLERLVKNATGPNASEKSKRDLQIVLDYLNVRDPADIGVDQHELWAQTQERYLMEGKAPSLELRSAFRTIKGWFMSVYKSLTHPQVNVPITDEVRGVFDRMMATDEEITAARNQLKLEAGYTDAAEAGMSEQQFADYQRLVERARTDSEDELLKKLTAAIRRERTAEWKAEAAELRPDVAAEVDQQPAISAMNYLRDNKVSLNREDVARLLEDDAAVAALPKTVPPLTSKNGLHPDVIAEATGFGSGAELLAGLAALEAERQGMLATGDKRSVRSKRIDDEVTARLREVHGDPFTDGSIEAEAMAAVHNERQAEVLHLELSVATRRVGGVPPPINALREWAAEKIGSRPVSEARSGKYLRAERKAANAVQKAAASRDFAEVARQKQAQTMNHLLYGAARRAEDFVEAAVKRMRKLDKARTIKSMDQAYLEQIHGLLEAFDLREVSGRQVKRRQSLAEFIAAQEAQGKTIVLPAKLAEMAARQHYSTLTVDELKALDDTVRALAKLGRLKKQLTVKGEQRDLDAIADQAQKSADHLPTIHKDVGLRPKDQWFAKLADFGVAFEASMVKAQEWFRLLDGGDPAGIFSTVLDLPANAAFVRMEELNAKFFEAIVASEALIPKAVKAKWMDLVSDHPFMNPSTGEPLGGVQRRDLIAIALQTGNLSNFEIMAKGWGIIPRDAEMEAITAARTALVAWLDTKLDATEWAYVQTWWDGFEGNKADYFATAREINGYAPEAVEAAPLTTSAGELAGGYVPVSYDGRFDRLQQERDAADTADMFGGLGRSSPRPDNGSTKERTGYSGPPLLNLDAIANGARKHIRYIAYAKYIDNSLKFLRHPVVAKTVRDKLGEQARKGMEDWLGSQVKMDTPLDPNANPFIKAARWSRTNMTSALLLGSVNVLLAQPSGLAVSVATLGPRRLASGMMKAANLMATGRFNEFVFSRSKIMKDRFEGASFERDIRLALTNMVGSKDLRDRITYLCARAISAIDVFVVSGPTWIAAYDRALADGRDEETAVYLADKAAEGAQGSGRASTLSAIQRNNEVTKMVTFAYGWANALYNIQRGAATDLKNGVNRTHAAYQLAAVMLLPAIADALMSGDWPDFEDEEDPVMAIMAWFGRNVLFGAFSGIPVVRDFAGAAERKAAGKYAGPVGQTAMGRIGDEFGKLGQDAWDLAFSEDGEVSRRWPSHAINSVGFALGLPGTAQLARSVNYATDVADGEQNPDGVIDWMSGLAKGPQEDQK